MARYKLDQRETLQLLSGSLDTFLPQESVARVIWAVLEQLDFSVFESRFVNDERGRTALHPRCLMAVWMLGMLRGVTSSVRLAALCATDIEFRWIIGDVQVEKSTLCSFRKDCKEELLKISAQVLCALGNNGLLPGENMGVDGTVVRAAASRHSVKTRGQLEKQRNRIEEVLRKKLEAPEERAGPEENLPLEKRQKKIEQALETMKALHLDEEKSRLTLSEPEAKFMRQKDNSFAPGYNAQVVTDLTSGVIVHAQIVDASNDTGQLLPQVEQAREALRECMPEASIKAVAADCAYHESAQLVALEESGLTCYVPNDRNTKRSVPGVAPEYHASHFLYEEEHDLMRCPQGQPLRMRKRQGESMTYQAQARTCQSCEAKPQCCPNTRDGRSVNRPIHKEKLDELEQRLKTPDGKAMKLARWICVEGAFARINRGLSWGRCRTWGKAGAEMELHWRVLTHNLMLLTRRWKPLMQPAESHAG